MASDLVVELREQGRGMMGALIFGTPFLYTMETWWLGWRLPALNIVIYTLVGLALVLLVTRNIGFRLEETRRRPTVRRLALDFAELVLQAFVVAYAVLLMFGVLEIGDPLSLVARLGLMQVIPLAFGAALANRLLRGEEGGDGAAEAPFPKDVAIFALGALFLIFPIVPTEEMELIAAHAGWMRLALVVLVSLVVTYLALYELEFRGQKGRVMGLSIPLRLGETCLVYAVAFAVAFGGLAAFGHFADTNVGVWIQETIVIAFVASLGGSAARVVL